MGDRSTQEGGAVAYFGEKQQSTLRWLGKYVDVEELHLEEAIANLPGQVSKVITGGGHALGGRTGGLRRERDPDIPDPVLPVPRWTCARSKRLFRSCR